MMRTNVFAMCLLALAAPLVAKDLASGLPGSWTVDKVAAFEAVAPPIYKMATPEKQKEMLADAMKSMPDMVLTFTATTASMKAGTAAPQVANYKVTKQEQSTLWVELAQQKKEGGTAAPDKFTFEFVDANTFKMLHEGDPAPLVLKRSK
jgi:hypothetical protein